mmetsp:Transcript_18736/g.58891  ORF Transcript_18736/g.58891 Transcript_18736/m.58891 type:complete len:202 (+) Transcript_18736:186-791(+)
MCELRSPIRRATRDPHFSEGSDSVSSAREAALKPTLFTFGMSLPVKSQLAGLPGVEQHRYGSTLPTRQDRRLPQTFLQTSSLLARRLSLLAPVLRWGNRLRRLQRSRGWLGLLCRHQPQRPQVGCRMAAISSRSENLPAVCRFGWCSALGRRRAARSGVPATPFRRSVEALRPRELSADQPLPDAGLHERSSAGRRKLRRR